MIFDPIISSVSPIWALTNAVARTVFYPNAKKLPCPVISVGNIVAGGVGKTELAAAIAARLVHKNLRVVVASRGYGSKWEGFGACARDSETALSLGFPDESIVILKKAPGALVAVGANRYENLMKHWNELLPDVVILDDGFQHFKLKRDLDILVHNFNIRWPIIRDFPRLLGKADVRVTFSSVPKEWNKLEWVRANYKLKGAVDAYGRHLKLPFEALAFCGLGNPERFKTALTNSGVKIQSFKTFQDHTHYDDQRVREIVAWSRERSGLPILTTLKDYVKLGHYVESQGGIAGFEPLWVPIELEFLENQNVLWKAIDEILASSAT